MASLQRFDSPQSSMCHTGVPKRSPRVAFYSHDTMGMGHLRRNLLIASSLVASAPSASSQPVEALLVAGTREAGFFAAQAGLDCVTLPALAKDIEGRYSARHMNWSLEKTIRLRSQVIATTLKEFQPDVLVVDKIPLGIANELLPALKQLRNTPTRCVLGLRDVLDEPEVVSREWEHNQTDSAIEAYFDELWIYGDPSVYDSVSEYDFSKTVSCRAHYTGYLNQSNRNANSSSFTCNSVAKTETNEPPFALCVVGGGQDGFALAKAFAQSDIPKGWSGIIITGPFMPPAQQKMLQSYVAQRSDIRIIDHLVETDDYLSKAERVVAMGGYNTVTAIFSFGKPALIVPRTRPRREQWIRAERLVRSGWTSILDPDQLHSKAIGDWLQQSSVPQPKLGCVDMDGLKRIRMRVDHLCSTPFLPQTKEQL